MVDRNTEEQLELKDIQGDILVGLQKEAELFVGFAILDPARFKHFLSCIHLTTAQDALIAERRIDLLRQNGRKDRLDIRGVNIAFTFKGLEKLGAPDLGMIKDESFRAGLPSRSEALNDPPSGPGALANWLVGNGVGPLDGLLIITGRGETEVQAVLGDLDVLAGENTWRPFYTEIGTTRPGKFRAHEHFGFLDGVSQPAVRGRIDGSLPYRKFLNESQNPEDPNQGLPGADLHWPGEFVFGYDEQDGTDPEKHLGKKDGGPKWMKNGSFMVFRRLEQLVPEFHRTADAKAEALHMPADLLEARMVGRWPSGAPTRLRPKHDDPALGGNVLENNDFEFGSKDPRGATCPFAAHIRKAYPRNDQTPAARGDTVKEREESSEADTQKHRIMRRGIPFGPELGPSEQAGTRESRGLMFVCYQTSIQDQFEFITINWINNPGFAIPEAGFDPILGQAKGEDRTRFFTGAQAGAPSGQDPKTVLAHDFIRPTGGGYFFMPSISAIQKILTQ